MGQKCQPAGANVSFMGQQRHIKTGQEWLNNAAFAPLWVLIITSSGKRYSAE